MIHFGQYLASAHQADFYKANKKQVRLFMGHLEKQGGAGPDPARLRCDWSRARGYPDGRKAQQQRLQRSGHHHHHIRRR